MKAAVLREVGRLDIEDVDLNGPRAGEVRVRLLATGLCHSDYHVLIGQSGGILPAILGHEGAGIVEAVGDGVRGLAVGDLVVACTSSYCGHCVQCLGGHSHRCEDKPARPPGIENARLTKDGEAFWQLAGLGTFAEAMVVDQTSIVKIPEGVPAPQAALLGCAVVTGFGAVIAAAKVVPGSSVAVVGAGGVGLNVIQAARIAGAAQIVAVDLNEDKFALARAFGATDTVAGGVDAVADVRERSRGGVDYAFEIIGLPATMRDACAMLRRGGTAVLMGVAAPGAELTVPIMPFWYDEIRIVGSLLGSVPFQTVVPRLARLYLDGRLLLDELVSETIALPEINEGYRRMAEGKVARSVVVFG